MVSSSNETVSTGKRIRFAAGTGGATPYNDPNATATTEKPRTAAVEEETASLSSSSDHEAFLIPPVGVCCARGYDIDSSLDGSNRRYRRQRRRQETPIHHQRQLEENDQEQRQEEGDDIDHRMPEDRQDGIQNNGTTTREMYDELASVHNIDVRETRAAASGTLEEENVTGAKLPEASYPNTTAEFNKAAKAYAPYLKIEIPRVLIELDDRDGNAKTKTKDDNGSSSYYFRKVVYVSQIRNVHYSQNKPSLYLLRKAVARTMWKLILREQAQAFGEDTVQQPRRHDDEEDHPGDKHNNYLDNDDDGDDGSYLKSLFETESVQSGMTEAATGLALNQNLPHSIRLKYFLGRGQGWHEVDSDETLKQVLRHPPKGGVRIRLVYNPSSSTSSSSPSPSKRAGQQESNTEKKEQIALPFGQSKKKNSTTPDEHYQFVHGGLVREVVNTLSSSSLTTPAETRPPKPPTTIVASSSANSKKEKKKQQKEQKSLAQSMNEEASVSGSRRKDKAPQPSQAVSRPPSADGNNTQQREERHRLQQQEQQQTQTQHLQNDTSAPPSASRTSSKKKEKSQQQDRPKKEEQKQQKQQEQQKEQPPSEKQQGQKEADKAMQKQQNGRQDDSQSRESRKMTRSKPSQCPTSPENQHPPENNADQPLPVRKSETENAANSSKNLQTNKESLPTSLPASSPLPKSSLSESSKKKKMGINPKQSIQSAQANTSVNNNSASTTGMGKATQKNCEKHLPLDSSSFPVAVLIDEVSSATVKDKRNISNNALVKQPQGQQQERATVLETVESGIASVTHVPHDIPQIELSLCRNPDALVRLDIDYLYDDYGNFSYWRLVEAASRLFHINDVEKIFLYYVSEPPLQLDGTKEEIDVENTNTMHEISNDKDLLRYLATGEAEAGDKRLPTVVHHIRVIDSTILVTRGDGTHLDVPFGLLMDPVGQFSFSKLMDWARMAYPYQPVKALTYLSPKDKNSKGDKTPEKIWLLNSSNAFDKAFQNQVPPKQNITVHPVFQANPLKLPAVAVTFLVGECSKVNGPPRVRMLANNAVVGWDLSSLVPGRYRMSLDYYRGTSSGVVYVHVGTVQEYPDKLSSDEAADQCRSNLLKKEPEYLLATGSDPFDPRHFGTADVGEFELLGNRTATGSQYFVVAAEKAGEKPLMSVKGLVCTYVGI